MKHPWIAMLLMSLSLATFRAESAPDDLDPSFGTGGQHFFEAYDEYGIPAKRQTPDSAERRHRGHRPVPVAAAH